MPPSSSHPERGAEGAAPAHGGLARFSEEPLEAVLERPDEPAANVRPPPRTGPEPIVYPIDLEDKIDPDAAKVVRRLVRQGYEAYLVGGCVRDLLVGRAPKDFDVATSARPDDVRRLFRNSRIIGRRFRLVHVLFSGGKVIETATFRRAPEQDEGEDDLLIRVHVTGDWVDLDVDGTGQSPPDAVRDRVGALGGIVLRSREGLEVRLPCA